MSEQLYGFTAAQVKLINELIRAHRNAQGRLGRPREAVDDHQAPETYIALTPTGGIPARTGTTPGQAECNVFQAEMNGTTRRLRQVPGLTRVVLNIQDQKIPGNKYVETTRDKYGEWLASYFPSSSVELDDREDEAHGAGETGTGTGTGTGTEGGDQLCPLEVCFQVLWDINITATIANCDVVFNKSPVYKQICLRLCDDGGIDIDEDSEDQSDISGTGTGTGTDTACELAVAPETWQQKLCVGDTGWMSFFASCGSGEYTWTHTIDNYDVLTFVGSTQDAAIAFYGRSIGTATVTTTVTDGAGNTATAVGRVRVAECR